MATIKIVALQKSWPETKINIDLIAEHEKILAIAGPSGSGKTTMLKMIAGLLPVDSGSIFINEKDISKKEPHERGIGMVFQDYALFPHLDVAGNIGYGLSNKNHTKKQKHDKIHNLLELVELHGFEKRRIYELSGGEKQRVALARSLATEPDVLLFDEPLSSLDTELRKRLRRDISAMQKRLKFTAIYVTHDLEEAMALGDSLAIIDNGSILQLASPAEIWQNPANVRVANFMGSGACLKIQSYETSHNTFFATTKTGRFPIANKNSDYAYIYFTRSVAKLCETATASTAHGYFEASCISKDFIGDHMECLMDAGGEQFMLRFSPHNAPSLGQNNLYKVDMSNVKYLYS